jgi:hypothetical protein
MNDPRSESVCLDLSLLSLGLPVNDGTSQGLNQKGHISVAVVIEELWNDWEKESGCQLNTE